MATTQISVFLENKKGRLAEVTRLLSGAGINMRASPWETPSTSGS